jgi:hypothetical protein
MHFKHNNNYVITINLLHGISQVDAIWAFSFSVLRSSLALFSWWFFSVGMCLHFWSVHTFYEKENYGLFDNEMRFMMNVVIFFSSLSLLFQNVTLITALSLLQRKVMHL